MVPSGNSNANTAPTAVLPAGNQWYVGGPPETYPGQLTAGFNPIQQQAWNMGNDAYQFGINAATNNARAARNMAGRYLSGVSAPATGISADVGAGDIAAQYLNMMTPEEINAIQGNFEVNPYVNDQVQAYQDAFTRGFQRSLPQQNIEAMLAGQMGSSRHGIAEGLARSDFQRQLGEGTAGLLNTAWAQAAQNQLTSRGQTLGALAQDRARGTGAAQAQAANRARLAAGNAANATSAYGSRMGALSSMPSLISTMTDVNMLAPQTKLRGADYRAQQGLANQQLAQRMIDAERARWDQQQNAPMEHLKNLADIYATTYPVIAPAGNRPQVAQQKGFFDYLTDFIPTPGGAPS